MDHTNIPLVALRDALVQIADAPAEDARQQYALCELLHQSALKIAFVDSCYVCRYSADKQTLQFVYNTDDTVYDDPVVMPLGNGPTSQVIRTGKPFVLSPENDATHQAGVNFGDMTRISRSAIHVPLYAGGSHPPLLLGVFSIQSYTEGRYDACTVRMVEILADAAGRCLAAGNARVEEQRRRQVQESEQKKTEALLTHSREEYVQSLFALGQQLDGLRRLSVPAEAESLTTGLDEIRRFLHRVQTEILLGMAPDDTSASSMPVEAIPAAPDPVSVESPAASLPAHLLTLTEREREVALLLARGLTNAEIGRLLFVTAGTIKFHVANILCKLEAKNRTDAARRITSLIPLLPADDE